MKLLTLLEEADYLPTTFTWENQEFLTKFSPIATCEILKPDRLTVFLTQEAMNSIFPSFREELPRTLPVETIVIPAGSDPQELWEIARLLSQNIDEDEVLALDITHGPLSFPLVSLMVAIFVRITRNVKLIAIFYGAYGIDKDVQPDKTPIFDLGPMFAWIEWYSAVNRFIQTANIDPLSSLLKEHRKRLARISKNNPAAMSQLGHLGKLAGVLENISSSLHMIRPYQVMEHIADLEDRLQKALPMLNYPQEGISYIELFEGLVDAYLPLAYHAPTDPQNAQETLLIEKRLINWYAQREFWVEANTLAREWLISWLMYQLGLRDFTQTTARQRVESVLAAEAHDFLFARKNKQTFQSIFLQNIPNIDSVLSLWLELIDVRNDINHAGMRPAPNTPNSLITRTKNNLVILNELADFSLA